MFIFALNTTLSSTGIGFRDICEKRRLKALILENQAFHNSKIWTDDNFELKPAKPIYTSINMITQDPLSPLDYVIVD